MPIKCMLGHLFRSSGIDSVLWQPFSYGNIWLCSPLETYGTHLIYLGLAKWVYYVQAATYTYMHRHTQINKHKHIYICVCVCVCMCVCVCTFVCVYVSSLGGEKPIIFLLMAIKRNSKLRINGPMEILTSHRYFFVLKKSYQNEHPKLGPCS